MSTDRELVTYYESMLNEFCRILDPLIPDKFVLIGNPEQPCRDIRQAIVDITMNNMALFKDAVDTKKAIDRSHFGLVNCLLCGELMIGHKYITTCKQCEEKHVSL